MGDERGATDMEIVNRRPRKQGLTERDLEVIEIERAFGAAQDAWPAKAAEAHYRLGLTPQGYQLVLRALLDDPRALARAPEVIEPLRRLRASKGI